MLYMEDYIKTTKSLLLYFNFDKSYTLRQLQLTLIYKWFTFRIDESN
jgi:hypothetical protein